ncbi:MAG TPA: radical SAM protein [Terriglobia bacterium]|nr:radical SAM protein [Terriglobia bacterium]
MDLLLTHGYFLYEDPKELQIMKPYVPLGILYISSHLRAKGWDVEIFDTTFSTREELFRLLRSSPPAVLGIYANLMTRGNVIDILRAGKEAGWKTIVGGPEPGTYIEEYLGAGADVVVVGEGEVTTEELLAVFRDGRPGAADRATELTRINGIAFRALDGSVCRTPPRDQISNLDAQPWPDRDAVDIGRYLRAWREAHGQGSVSLITARGCPYRCRWCSHGVYGMTHRRRRPAAVVDEIEWLLDRYQPDMAWLADDVFTIHHGWLARYAAEMKERGLRIPFECISRADRLSPPVMDLLAELGCFRIWIGSESGSQRVLDAMERGVTVEQVRAAVALAKARGIRTGMFLMWGYSGEDIDDIEATINHVKHSDPDVFFTTVSYPIKGTPYFEEVASRVVSSKPWKESSDRDFGIRGRHSRRFYQYADELLGLEVDLNRLTEGALAERRGASPGRPTPESATAIACRIADLRQKIGEARDGLRSSFAEVEV